MYDWSPGSPEIRALWALNPEITYLNHGSFGATPRSVLAEQARLRAEMESEPIEFLARSWPARIGAVRRRVAAFLRADPDGLAFVPNASTGVETVLASFDWKAGDEIVFADQGYNAVRQGIRRLELRYGVKCAPVKVPFPLESAEQIANAFVKAITARTRLVIVDHVASPTALVFPVRSIVDSCVASGVPVLIDGAHAPGMIDLDIDALDADFYTGNLHKWVCSPKGAAFLHVARRARGRVHPLVTSHGFQQGFTAEFDWTGTDDPTAWLSLPAALEHSEQLGWSKLRETNHALVQRGRVVVAEALGAELPHADDPELYGSMAAIPLKVASMGDGPRLNALFYEKCGIEVPFTGYGDSAFVRISGQAYNAPSDYERLAEALRREFR